MIDLFSHGGILLQFCMLYGSLVTSACVFSFVFTIRHKSHFTAWARFSVITAFLSSLILTLIPISGIMISNVDPHILIFIKMFFQTAIATNVYTMIRTQWSWQEDFKIEIVCENPECPLIVRINKDKSED